MKTEVWRRPDTSALMTPCAACTERDSYRGGGRSCRRPSNSHLAEDRGRLERVHFTMVMAAILRGLFHDGHHCHGKTKQCTPLLQTRGMRKCLIKHAWMLPHQHYTSVDKLTCRISPSQVLTDADTATPNSQSEICCATLSLSNG